MLLPPPPPVCAQASEINKLVISEPVIVWKIAELSHNTVGAVIMRDAFAWRPITGGVMMTLRHSDRSLLK